MIHKRRCVYVFSPTLFSVLVARMYDLKPNWSLPKSATAFRYKKLERYLFHNISLCIPWHTRTHNCSSRNVQHTFHCSDKANCCMETEKERKMISSPRAIIPSRSMGFSCMLFSICVAGSNRAVIRASIV